MYYGSNLGLAVLIVYEYSCLHFWRCEFIKIVYEYCLHFLSCGFMDVDVDDDDIND